MTASLLPPNATPLELALAQTMAAQLGALDAPLRDLWNPQTCPENLLPWLAWSLAVDNWDSTWPIWLKRARVTAAIVINRHKGTLQAVYDVVNAYGGIVHMATWWQTLPPGAPYTFQLWITPVAIDGAAPTADFINGLIADVTRAKGARDTFTFTISQNGVGAIGVIGAARAAVYARLECAATQS
jgi:phage tail P2-like protein